MRSTKLTAAGVAAAALLTLAPAIASAAGGHGSHRIRHASAGSCRATLNVAPRLITAGESVVAYGRLSCATAAEEEKQTVTLYEGSVPRATQWPVRARPKRKASTRSKSAPLTASTVFHVVAGTARKPVAGRSRWRRRSRSTGPAEGTQLLAGRRAGGSQPCHVHRHRQPGRRGRAVVLQRQNATTGNEWHRIEFGRVGAGGSFTITHRFVVPGDANIRVLVRGRHRNVASPSNVLTYEISQAQNPALTINASADPIPYGQSVTISGTVAADHERRRSRCWRTRAHQDGFAPVAQVKTNASGDYKFPPSRPSTAPSTRCRATAVSSAVALRGRSATPRPRRCVPGRPSRRVRR